MKVVRIGGVEAQDDSTNRIFNGTVSIQHVIGQGEDDFRVNAIGSKKSLPTAGVWCIL